MERADGPLPSNMEEVKAPGVHADEPSYDDLESNALLVYIAVYQVGRTRRQAGSQGQVCID